MPTLVTWNLDGLEGRHLDLRAEAACLELLLRDEPPDIVAFQEVVDRTLTAHLRPHFAHSGYMAAVQPATGEYYCALFVRTPARILDAECHVLPDTRQGRMLLQATVQLGDRRIRVQTAHFESGRDARLIRIDQVAAAVALLDAFDGPSVLMGDTNLREAEVKRVPGLDRYRDAWVLGGRPDPLRVTWQPRAQRPGRTIGARFDRVFLSPHWQAARIAPLGTTPVDGADGMTVSDHIGLEVRAQ